MLAGDPVSLIGSVDPQTVVAIVAIIQAIANAIVLIVNAVKANPLPIDHTPAESHTASRGRP